MKRRARVQVALAAAALAIFTASARFEAAAQAKSAKPAVAKAGAQIPAGARGEAIRLGQHIFEQTPRYAAGYVGNQMSCADCHLQGGRAAYSAPLAGLTHIFPTYNQRAGRVITLAERIQQCFVRSENGKPLAPDSREMKALLAYTDWLSQATPKGRPFPGRGLVKLPSLQGNAGHGAPIYAKQCAVCHGEDGAGVPPILPPLWGPGSFNSGAGMSTVPKMAAFVQHNMPQNAPGTLSAQESYDVAAYVNSKPRPKLNPAYKNY